MIISEFFGILSGLLAALSTIPYIRGIFLHVTKPERASWFIFVILSTITFFSQIAIGATYSSWLSGVQMVGDIIIFGLSLKYGMGGFMRRDVVALVITVFGLGLWYLTKQPLVALFFAVGIDAVSVVLTLTKTYEFPETENIISWSLVGASGFAALFGVGIFDWRLYLWPVYICLAGFSVVVVVLIGKRKKIGVAIKLH